MPSPGRTGPTAGRRWIAVGAVGGGGDMSWRGGAEGAGADAAETDGASGVGSVFTACPGSERAAIGAGGEDARDEPPARVDAVTVGRARRCTGGDVVRVTGRAARGGTGETRGPAVRPASGGAP
ncbi:hypothetical protein [Streptomyces sp. NBC_01497]|uniref:hypothetical protein n=1 Tax=Streptomyces sp. NBC_01497 TaxID=2903885 RepID=UPI002E32CD5E|nr:hypothetical protein [Streptomyces sp. NBC_01497]